MMRSKKSSPESSVKKDDSLNLDGLNVTVVGFGGIAKDLCDSLHKAGCQLNIKGRPKSESELANGREPIDVEVERHYAPSKPAPRPMADPEMGHTAYDTDDESLSSESPSRSSIVQEDIPRVISTGALKDSLPIGSHSYKPPQWDQGPDVIIHAADSRVADISKILKTLNEQGLDGRVLRIPGNLPLIEELESYIVKQVESGEKAPHVVNVTNPAGPFMNVLANNLKERAESCEDEEKAKCYRQAAKKLYGDGALLDKRRTERVVRSALAIDPETEEITGARVRGEHGVNLAIPFSSIYVRNKETGDLKNFNDYFTDKLKKDGENFVDAFLDESRSNLNFGKSQLFDSLIEQGESTLGAFKEVIRNTVARMGTVYTRDAGKNVTTSVSEGLALMAGTFHDTKFNCGDRKTLTTHCARDTKDGTFLATPVKIDYENGAVYHKEVELGPTERTFVQRSKESVDEQVKLAQDIAAVNRYTKERGFVVKTTSVSTCEKDKNLFSLALDTNPEGKVNVKGDWQDPESLNTSFIEGLMDPYLAGRKKEDHESKTHPIELPLQREGLFSIPAKMVEECKMLNVIEKTLASRHLKLSFDNGDPEDHQDRKLVIRGVNKNESAALELAEIDQLLDDKGANYSTEHPRRRSRGDSVGNEDFKNIMNRQPSLGLEDSPPIKGIRLDREDMCKLHDVCIEMNKNAAKPVHPFSKDNRREQQLNTQRGLAVA